MLKNSLPWKFLEIWKGLDWLACWSQIDILFALRKARRACVKVLALTQFACPSVRLSCMPNIWHRHGGWIVSKTRQINPFLPSFDLIFVQGTCFEQKWGYVLSKIELAWLLSHHIFDNRLRTLGFDGTLLVWQLAVDWTENNLVHSTTLLQESINIWSVESREAIM